MSPRNTCTRLVASAASRFSRRPRLKSSTIRTDDARAASAWSTMWEPMKPAPPVTRTTAPERSHCMVRSVEGDPSVANRTARRRWAVVLPPASSGIQEGRLPRATCDHVPRSALDRTTAKESASQVPNSSPPITSDAGWMVESTRSIASRSASAMVAARTGTRRGRRMRPAAMPPRSGILAA